MSLRTPLLIGSLMLLTACGSSVSLTFTAKSSLNDEGKNALLFQAAERVFTRRLAAFDVKSPNVKVVPKDTMTASISMTVPPASVKTVQRIAADPFTFDIRLEDGVIKDSKGVEQTNWVPTGIDGSMLTWIQPVRSPDESQVGVELEFSELGQSNLQKAFTGNAGKDVGIFVRDLLVSKMKINSDKVSEHIIIGGIPSAKVAEIFADDVNVGLHLSFTASK
jgi:preprotein translocase subunit SecD